MVFNGTAYRNPKVIKEQWKNYFETLYFPSEYAHYDNEWKTNVDQRIQHVVSHSVLKNDVYISPESISTALLSCKRNKACGNDQIYYEHVIYGNQALLNVISLLFTSMLRTGHIQQI